VPRLPVARLEPVIGAGRLAELVEAAARFRRRFADRTVWNVNSTAVGGGVAEMLQVLVGYVEDLDIDIRWRVISGDADFFAITKRLHNRIHGQPGDGGPLGTREAGHYREVLAGHAEALASQIRPGDLVLLHDPQTAGLAAPLVERGARVVWRCHIGADAQNEVTAAAWVFLTPFLARADAFVFSRQQHVPPWSLGPATWIIPPSIDPVSPKNQDLDEHTVRTILTRIGVLAGDGTPGAATFTRSDGTPGHVTRRALVTAEQLPGPDDQLVVQVSRWDRLKDMAGVLRGFTEHVAPAGAGYLVLAGPAVSGVSDDPEGLAVYEECLAEWRSLPASVRGRSMLVTLPLDDVDENAAMVNALQRQAAVIVQKSLAEGFGLTVAEGMWKGRPVVGSAVGGIQDQIVADTGVLLPDPTDLEAFGKAARRLLDDPDQAERMGAAARDYVRDHFIGDIHLLHYAQLFETLIGDE
jgi:trehalose synthase